LRRTGLPSKLVPEPGWGLTAKAEQGGHRRSGRVGLSRRPASRCTTAMVGSWPGGRHLLRAARSVSRRCPPRFGTPGFTTHDARHTAATLLLVEGLPARVVMAMHGHSQLSLALGTYSHVGPELPRVAAERMGKALRGWAWPPRRVGQWAFSTAASSQTATGSPHSRARSCLAAGRRCGAGGARTHDPGIMRRLNAHFRPSQPVATGRLSCGFTVWGR
jgi:hypothetical protein